MPTHHGMAVRPWNYIHHDISKKQAYQNLQKYISKIYFVLAVNPYELYVIKQHTKVRRTSNHRSIPTYVTHTQLLHISNLSSFNTVRPEQRFRMNFLQLTFSSNFIQVHSSASNWQVSFGLGNGLSQSRRQPIVWTNGRLPYPLYQTPVAPFTNMV